MKTIYFFFICFILSQNTLCAQIPGYQGKRLFFEAGVSFFPNFGYPTAQNLGSNTFPSGLPSSHFTMKDYYSASIHYVTSRKLVLKGGYTYQVSGLDVDEELPSKLFPGYTDHHDMFYQIHSHDINFGLEVYGTKNANLAPLGFYWNIGLRAVFSQGYLKDYRVEYSDQRSNQDPILNQINSIPEATTVFLLGVTGSLGYRMILADRLVLNIAGEVNLFPQHFLLSAGFIKSYDLTAYEYGILLSIPDRYFISLHIGLGVLLF